jgi:hypothetical protein
VYITTISIPNLDMHLLLDKTRDVRKAVALHDEVAGRVQHFRAKEIVRDHLQYLLYDLLQDEKVRASWRKQGMITPSQVAVDKTGILKDIVERFNDVSREGYHVVDAISDVLREHGYLVSPDRRAMHKAAQQDNK